MTLQQWAAADSAPWAKINENAQTLEHQACYGQRQRAHSGLTYGYYGGRWGGFSIADGTLTLTNAADNYVVVLKSTGAISVSTSNTNWNDTTSYARVYKITTAGSVVTATEDHRAGPNGVHGGAGSTGAGTELKGLTFTSDTASQADSDPGAGKLRWNNATLTSATTLYIDNTTADGASLVTLYGYLAAAGTLFLQQSDDAARWQLWKWTATPVDGTGYRKLTVSLLANGASAIQDAKTIYADFANDDAGAGGTTAGKHAIFIAAGSMLPAISSGCAPLLSYNTGASKPDIASLDFDPSSVEYAHFWFVMPKKWNESTITFRAHVKQASTSSGGVAFSLQGVAVSDGDSIAASFGTAVVVTDTVGTLDTNYTSAESSAVTIAGSPAAEDLVCFRVARETANGSDTLAIDAGLLGITLYITTDADTDA